MNSRPQQPGPNSRRPAAAGRELARRQPGVSARLHAAGRAPAAAGCEEISIPHPLIPSLYQTKNVNLAFCSILLPLLSLSLLCLLSTVYCIGNSIVNTD